jgi:hypothetical protein
MRPFLRTADQGADSIVFLAAAEGPLDCTGAFWHDRRPRPVHRLPRTHEAPGERERLWSYLVEKSGWQRPPTWPAPEAT